jgi:hypothetical protein
MKKTLCLLPAILSVVASSASAQGLLSLGQRNDFDSRLPFAVTVGMNVGYDSNSTASATDESGSSYISGHVGLEYNTGGKRRTAYTYNASYSPTMYLSGAEGRDDLFHNVRAGFSVLHKVNPRLSISDSAYIAYEIEPNYGIGATVARRTQQYLYGYNSLAVSYAWNRRLSTVSSYTISGTKYDDDAFSGEDAITNLFSQEVRYALNKTTTLAGTYRYAISNYDNGFGDYTSQYFLAGVDHKFSPRMVASVRAGAEVRDRDSTGSSSSPYAEGNLTYSVAKQTQLGWYHRLGFEDSDVGSFGDRYSYRTGLTLNQRLSPRMAANVGTHYIHDNFENSEVSDDFSEDIFTISLGLDYNVFRNVNLNTGYSYTTVASGESLREYDRHMLSVGVSARF